MVLQHWSVYFHAHHFIRLAACQYFYCWTYYITSYPMTYYCNHFVSYSDQYLQYGVRCTCTPNAFIVSLSEGTSDKNTRSSLTPIISSPLSLLEPACYFVLFLWRVTPYVVQRQTQTLSKLIVHIIAYEVRYMPTTSENLSACLGKNRSSSIGRWAW